jgi:hypothetical protein
MRKGSDVTETVDAGELSARLQTLSPTDFNRLRSLLPECWGYVDPEGATFPRIPQLIEWAISSGTGLEAVCDRLCALKSAPVNLTAESVVALIDRHMQVKMFVQRARAHFLKSRDPLIVVVHGAIDAAHLDMVKRLLEKEFDDDSLRMRKPRYNLTGTLPDDETFGESLSEAILDKLHRRGVKHKDWIESLAGLSLGPNEFVALQVNLTNAKYPSRQIGIIKRIKEFFSGHAPRLANSQLIVFVCVTYEHCAWSFTSWFCRLCHHRYAPALDDFGGPNGGGLVLPQLGAVSPTDIREWAQAQDFEISTTQMSKIFGGGSSLTYLDAMVKLRTFLRQGD